ncbi:MAG: glycosyltransferase [Cytophagaceae bacterium]|nr:glycosyltransferase [Cytophagaceae bacterium]
MRILFIHTYYRLPGGEDAVLQNEMDLLTSLGHEVELLAFDNKDRGLCKLLLMPFNPFSYRKTKAKVKEFQPDIVHIHNLHFAASASVIYAIRSAKIPMVMTIHNYRLLCPSASLFYKGSLFLDSLAGKFPWSAVRKGVYQNSILITFWLAFSTYIHKKIHTYDLVDKFIFLNPHSKQLFLVSTFGVDESKCVIKPNYLLDTKVSMRPKKDTFFLFIGRLTEEKGVYTLLKAFEDSSIWLKIAGIGPLQSVVEEYAQRNSNIEYLGQQSREEVSCLLDDAEALIFPSIWYETFGMTIVEAFAKAVPVITSYLGNMKVIVTNQVNGLLFEPGNADELRSRVEEFYTSPVILKSRFRQNARASYEQNYTSEINAIKLLAIYNSCVPFHHIVTMSYAPSSSQAQLPMERQN